MEVDLFKKPWLYFSANKKPKPNQDPSTIIAAVGAGLIPATMAMLVPMAMGGKRRKRELRFVTRRPLDRTVEMQLQASL